MTRSICPFLKASKKALKNADPKSRDRLRHRVKVLEVAAVLRSPGRSYKRITMPKMPWDDKQV